MQRNKSPKLTMSEIRLLVPQGKPKECHKPINRFSRPTKSISEFYVNRNGSSDECRLSNTSSTNTIVNPPEVGKSSAKPIFKVQLNNSTNIEQPNTKKGKSKAEEDEKIILPENSHFDMITSARPKLDCTSSSIGSSSDDVLLRVYPCPKGSTNSKTFGSNKHKENHWEKPCKGSFVPGATAQKVGYCPPTIEQIATMSKERQKFFLTQDPRKKFCLRNPKALHAVPISKKKELQICTDKVKHADNLCKSSNVKTEPFICEIIDPENPMQLDFHGLDYKTTFEQDEQDIHNIRAYTNVGHYMSRKRVKAETQILVEKELQAERIALPKCFDVPDRNIYFPEPPIIEPVKYGKVFRADSKPSNKKRIEKEQAERKNRYKMLYLEKKKKTTLMEHEKKEQKALAQKKIAQTLAEEYFQNVVNGIDESIETSLKKEIKVGHEDVKRRIFPHTMHETQLLKRQLKERDRKIRDEMKVRKEFFRERTGKEKVYPEADLEISSDSHKSESEELLSEKTSDFEDDFEVGKKRSIFKLRGFQYKLGKNLRGKNATGLGLDKTKACITREQWLQELAPKKQRVKLDVEVGLTKIKSPDDPNLMLFNPEFGSKAPIVDSSIKKFVNKPLGEHYKQDLRKNIKLLKPPLKYQVKKFNLIKFMFDETENKDLQIKEKYDLDDHIIKDGTTADYVKMKKEEETRKHYLEKVERLKLLGIPCKDVKESRTITRCESSNSDTDSDWVPEAEPEYTKQEEEGVDSVSKKVPFRLMGNMPAPKFRETTLRRHPRSPRKYDTERVPSELFDEVVKDSGIPHMRKIEPDTFQYANVKTKKRPYSEMLDARHHHDHMRPTNNTNIDVHYQPKIVEPVITKPPKTTDTHAIDLFETAEPPCNKFINMDLSLLKADTDFIIAQKLGKSSKTQKGTAGEKIIDLCRPNVKNVYRTRPTEPFAETDFPGRAEFIDFLQEVREAVQHSKTLTAEENENLLKVDKKSMYKELEDELKSIESCLTSLSDSVCTNLTDDSGSFLLVEGKTKVPLDYIRKSIVPFEELQRSRFRTKLIDIEAEENNPFKTMPFSGQLRAAQFGLKSKKDVFFTYNTRLRNGLRLRLEVPVEDVRQKLIGVGKNQYYSLVATDIDENYVTGLKNRLRVKMCQFKSGRHFIKDALRLKFESLLIQGQIVRNKIYDRLNAYHWETMLKSKALYEKLFSIWEKREYDAAREIVYKVKDYYDTTDRLKREANELKRQLTLLNMDIVFIEGFWIRRIMLQNFHYLMAEQEWRYEHDWIHRLEDDEHELETYEESIIKRSTINIRQREKDDAWAIKAFYENVYLKNLHPTLIVFQNAKSFLKGIETLKLKTFVILLELHYTLWIHTELQERHESFEEWCIQDLKEREEYVARKCAKLYYMEDRAEFLKSHTLKYMDEPLANSFSDERYNYDRGIIAQVWRQITPGGMSASTDTTADPVFMVTMISNTVMDLIAKFDHVDTKEARQIEAELRKERAFLAKQSFLAYQMERRIGREMQRIIKSLEPPFQKPKRVGKLKKYHIKKKEIIVKVEEEQISEKTKFFFRAFHDEGDVKKETARDSLVVVDKMQAQIVPFYFDHFLKINGYTPNYNFKTQIELRDGIEIERFKVKSLLPEVVEKVTKWEEQRKKTMEENIARNPRMYENVI